MFIHADKRTPFFYAKTLCLKHPKEGQDAAEKQKSKIVRITKLTMFQ